MNLDYGSGGPGSRPDQSRPTNPDVGISTDGGERADESPPDTRTCVRYVVWEEWRTAGGRACPQCAVFVGEWFERGNGPTPPLHPNCDCERVAVKWECYSTSGERVDEGWY
ncbi:MAG TPA: hypothetical protein VFI42_10815 [Thermomicrobiaceae bacterium]|nr:hypothetical protein [Thermomicrobiaceae bacterium]